MSNNSTCGCIAVIDHGFANIASITNMLAALGIEYRVFTGNHYGDEGLHGFILPGVGSFGPAMKNMRKTGTDLLVKRYVQKGLKGLGICLGMQLLAANSEEDDFSERGLGIFRGSIRKLDSGIDKVPNIGWHNTESVNNAPKPLNTLLDGTFYYAHSFVYDNVDGDSVIATHRHGNSMVASSIYMPNLLGVQFHPEKSQYDGLNLIHSWFTSDLL